MFCGQRNRLASASSARRPARRSSALRDRQWVPGLRFSLYGPQNARYFRLPLLPVVGITPVADTPHDHPHGSDGPLPWRHARCPWSRPPYVQDRCQHRRRCVPSCRSTTGCPSSMSASRDRALRAPVNTAFVNSWRSSRCWKFKMVVSSGIASRPSSIPANARVEADVVKRFFRAGIGEVVPLLQAINPASPPMEMAAARHSDQPWDNGARSQLRARPKEPQQPSQPGTHHASCASSWPHIERRKTSQGRRPAGQHVFESGH